MLKRKTPLKAKTRLTAKTSLKAKSYPFNKKDVYTDKETKVQNNTYIMPKPNMALPATPVAGDAGMTRESRTILKCPRVKNQSVIDACRRDTCEICGMEAGGEPHHVITRGAGGPDMPENLIQLCGICHRKAHEGKYKKDWLFGIISRRLKTSKEAIQEKLKEAMGRV